MSRRRSTKTREPREIGAAIGVTIIWAVAAAWSFWPVRQSNLMPLVVSTLIMVAVWAAAIVVVRARTRRNKTIQQLQALTPTEFEDWVAARFRELGYKVKLTGMGGDHGADLLAEKPGEQAIVQCKRYTSRSVGEPALRDLYGAMHDFGAQKGYLVTTGEVTGTARSWARGKPIAIWDGDDLARMAKASTAARPEELAPAPTEKPAAAGPTCPRCGATLVERRNRKTGEAFLGCSRFPKCRHTQPLES